jgi:uncharacterized SAM-binding protein YcdF (DUF218 family)
LSAQALVVLGSSLTGTQRRLVAAAERVARDRPVEIVVFTGAPNGSGLSEAEQMHRLWHGSAAVEVVREETASTTAENAARTLPILLERGIGDAVVLCSPLHVPRARWIFRRIYGEQGIAVTFELARVLPTPGALLWELGAFTVAARQVRAARARWRRG